MEKLNNKFKPSISEDEKLVTMADSSAAQVQWIPTNILALDRVMGGGLPRGRVVTIWGESASGKSTTALQIIAAVQKQGGNAAFIDAEQTYYPEWAEACGVDNSSLLLIRPDYGEQALDMVQELVKTNEFDVIVIDSVPALTPKAIVDKTVEERTMAETARMMTTFLSKVTPIIAKTKTALILLNQVRANVGVMYGCLHGDTPIRFVDGRTFTIEEVVKNKIKGEIYTYDGDKIVSGEITNWFDNGLVTDKDDWITFVTGSGDTQNGFAGVTVTPDHQILTSENVWKKAKDISTGDKLVSFYKSLGKSTARDFLYGTLVGDSTLSKPDFKKTSTLQLQDNENIGYMEWKVSKLNSVFNFSKHIDKGFINYKSTSMNEYLGALSRSFDNRDPMFMLNNYTDLSMAIWYMDDGSFDTKDYHCRSKISVKRFSKDKEHLKKIADKLEELGYGKIKIDTSGSLIFTAEGTRLLHSRIAKYVPDCMQYKLCEEEKGKYEDFTLHALFTQELLPVKINSITVGSPRKFRKKHKYDIEVSGYGCFSAGSAIGSGIIVHNSPTVMPGGKAIGFYSSIVLKVSKDKKQIVLDKLTGDAIGHMMIVKNEKNKVASPFRSSSYMFYYNQGADNREAVIDDAIFKGIIIKPASGPTYRINFNGQEVKIVGRGNICKYLMENQDVANYVVEATQVPEYYKNVFSKDWSVDTETEISNEEVSL